MNIPEQSPSMTMSASITRTVESAALDASDDPRFGGGDFRPTAVRHHTMHQPAPLRS